MTNELTDYIDDACLVITLAQGHPVNISICESPEQTRKNIFLENDGVVNMYSSENMHIFKQHETETEWIIIDNGHFILHSPVPDGEIIARNEKCLPGLNCEYVSKNGETIHSINEILKHLYIPFEHR